MSKGKDSSPSTNDSGFFSQELKSGHIESSECYEEKRIVEDFTPSFLLQKPSKVTIVNSEHYFEQDEDGFTRLHVAVLHSDQRTIDALLNIVPDVIYLNQRNSFGMSPLHIAVMLQDHLTIRKLIDSGCNPNLRCAGKNALHLAVESGDFQSAQIILSARKNTNELLVDLEMWNREGETCFYVACKQRNLQMMKLLLSKGCNINVREGRSGHTALHHATQEHAVDVIDFLIKESADVNAENYGGWTPYQLCLINDCEELAQKLVASGAIPYYTEEMDDESSDELDNHELITKISEITVNWCFLVWIFISIYILRRMYDDWLWVSSENLREQ